jgi:O-antigen ligase
MLSYINNLKLLSLKEWILLLYPFSCFSHVAVNVILVLSSFILILEVIKKKLLHYLKVKWAYLYITFIFYNIFNSFFSTDFLNAFQSGVSQFRFLFFAFFIYLCIPNLNNLHLIIKTWIGLLLFVCLDGIYQYIYTNDFFGFPKGATRLSGPFGDRLVLGTYLTYISIPIIFYYFPKVNKYNFCKKLFFIFIYLVLLLTITISGERLALIMFIFSSLFIFFFYTNLRKVFIFLLFLSIFIFFNFLMNPIFKARTNDLISILSNFYSSSYGRLYESSFLLFEKKPFFGVGFKNYRVDCNNQVDPRPNSPWQFCSTHPHNLYLEILTETGIVGFVLFFLIFYYFFIYILNKIKNNIPNKNYQKYSSLMYGNLLIIFIYLWPLKTSGSFFTTWNASFFWLNLGFVLLILRKTVKN